MVQALHEAGIEVILDVVYNHTAEGNHLGPMLSFKGIDNPAYYRLVPDDRALLHRLHRHREHPEHAPPARAAADHGQPALLGDRDARRRVPLRPRLDAGPPAPRGRPAVGVLRPHPAGPGRQPGEADRRAVGRRRGRLPGRQLPAAVVGVERPVPRHRPRLLARRAGRRSASSPTASPAAPTSTSPTRAGPRASINFVTAHDGFTLARPRLVQREAQRGQRRGQHATARATTARGTAASRARPTTPRCSPCGPASSATSWPRCSCRRACRCCCRRRRARPHPARQQQRLLPGQRDLLVRLGRRSTSDLLDVHARRSSRSAATTRCSAAAASSRAGRSRRHAPTSPGSRPTAPR